jgi:hypothetical protein
MIYYKLARPDGYDFYTGKTVNYRENIGKKIIVPHRYSEIEVPTLCSNNVLHACSNPNECFIGAKLPCSVYEVEGTPVVDDEAKQGFRELVVVREIPEVELDQLFGWKIVEAMNPVYPFQIQPPDITKHYIELLKEWASVWDSVKASVWDSVWASVKASVWAPVWASVGDSVKASVWAYIGNLFPNITKWKYIEHKKGIYPYQPAVDLWYNGLIPSYDGKIWRLHGGKEATVLYEEADK